MQQRYLEEGDYWFSVQGLFWVVKRVLAGIWSCLGVAFIAYKLTFFAQPFNTSFIIGEVVIVFMFRSGSKLLASQGLDNDIPKIFCRRQIKRNRKISICTGFRDSGCQ
jgi:hypothetical protein